MISRCCSSSMKQKSHKNLNSNVFKSSDFPWKFFFHCGDKDILRRTTMTKSYGKYFWGSPHFKVCMFYVQDVRTLISIWSSIVWTSIYVICMDLCNLCVVILNGSMRKLKMRKRKLWCLGWKRCWNMMYFCNFLGYGFFHVLILCCHGMYQLNSMSESV